MLNENEAVITTVEQLQLDWFQAVLRQCGALQTGAVEAFEVQPHDSDNSAIWKIRLTYRRGSTGELPERVLLKLCGGSNSHDFGPSEVYYYRRDYLSLTDAPLVRCYSAVYSATQKAYHLLLEDLSGSHTNNFGHMTTGEYAFPVAAALAKLHAYHWSAQPVASAVEPFPDPTRLANFFAYIDRGYAPLLAEIQAEFDPAQIALFEREYRQLKTRLLARLDDRQGFSLVHGDVNPGNILSPRSGSGPTYLVDRQPFDWSLTTWLAVSDLAYTMVLWWEPVLRRQLEEQVLRHYLAELVRQGVCGYGWEQLVADYKLSVAFCLWVPVEWNVLETDRQRMKWLWSVELKRILAALSEPV